MIPVANARKPTFLAHDCIPSKTKVQYFDSQKNFNVEISAISVGLQLGIKLSSTFLLETFEP